MQYEMLMAIDRVSDTDYPIVKEVIEQTWRNLMWVEDPRQQLPGAQHPQHGSATGLMVAQRLSSERPVDPQRAFELCEMLAAMVQERFTQPGATIFKFVNLETQEGWMWSLVADYDENGQLARMKALPVGAHK